MLARTNSDDIAAWPRTYFWIGGDFYAHAGYAIWPNTRNSASLNMLAGHTSDCGVPQCGGSPRDMLTSIYSADAACWRRARAPSLPARHRVTVIARSILSLWYRQT